jgi:hypothetical protein
MCEVFTAITVGRERAKNIWDRNVKLMFPGHRAHFPSLCKMVSDQHFVIRYFLMTLVYLFIYGQFNDVLSSLDYMALKIMPYT